MRITEKKKNGFYKLKSGNYIYAEEDGIRLVQIVGQFEDIGEELGINLITLFKALKQEVIYIKFDDEVREHHFMVEQRFGKYLIYDKEWLIELKDYGKTWALTKEELL